MEDKYINTTIVKGVGAALKAFAIEVPNMVTRRRVVIEKIINGTYTVPGTENAQEAPKKDAKQQNQQRQPKQPAPKPAAKPAATPKPPQPGTGDNNPQNGAGRNNQ